MGGVGFAPLDADGLLTFIPFARDGAAVATGPLSGAGATAITHADGLSMDLATGDGTLHTLYADCDEVTVDGVTYDPTGTHPGTQRIDLYVPAAAGSEMRAVWAAFVGFSSTLLPPCVHDTVQQGPDASQAVHDDDGTVYASDPDAIGPFGIAAWIAQRSGFGDVRHGAVLHSLNPNEIGGSPVAPIVGSPSTGTLNTSFPFTFPVYNVVETARITAPTDPLRAHLDDTAPYDATLAGLFASSTSQLCTDLIGIRQAGLAPITTCGDTTQRIIPNASAL
jgi:hypothetical protein